MIDELKSFIQVVDEQNFTKAAQKLNLSQPAVSMHISGLEKQLDTILILRSNKQKNFLLTPDGELLYKRAKKIGSIIFGVGDSHTSFIWNKK